MIARDGAGIVDIITHDGASDAASAELHLDRSGAEKTAILLMADEEAVRRCRPDMRRLGEIDVMAIVTARAGAGAAYDVVSRVFVPAWGVDEDPVTGSAHARARPLLEPNGSAGTPLPPIRRAGAAGSSIAGSPATAPSSAASA